MDKARDWLNRAVTVNPDLGDAWAHFYKLELLHGTKDEQQGACGFSACVIDALAHCVARSTFCACADYGVLSLARPPCLCKLHSQQFNRGVSRPTHGMARSGPRYPRPRAIRDCMPNKYWSKWLIWSQCLCRKIDWAVKIRAALFRHTQKFK